MIANADVIQKLQGLIDTDLINPAVRNRGIKKIYEINHCVDQTPKDFFVAFNESIKTSGDDISFRLLMDFCSLQTKEYNISMLYDFIGEKKAENEVFEIIKDFVGSLPIAVSPGPGLYNLFRRLATHRFINQFESERIRLPQFEGLIETLKKEDSCFIVFLKDANYLSKAAYDLISILLREKPIKNVIVFAFKQVGVASGNDPKFSAYYTKMWDEACEKKALDFTELEDYSIKAIVSMIPKQGNYDADGLRHLADWQQIIEMLSEEYQVLIRACAMQGEIFDFSLAVNYCEKMQGGAEKKHDFNLIKEKLIETEFLVPVQEPIYSFQIKGIAQLPMVRGGEAKAYTQYKELLVNDWIPSQIDSA